MIKYLTGLLILLVAIYAVFLRGNQTIDALTATDIATVLTKANTFDGKRVTVSGTVLDSAAIMGLGGYRLKQGDAELFVISSHGIPETGNRVTVSGTFKQAFAFNNLQYAVVLEK